MSDETNGMRPTEFYRSMESRLRNDAWRAHEQFGALVEHCRTLAKIVDDLEKRIATLEARR